MPEDQGSSHTSGHVLRSAAVGAMRAMELEYAGEASEPLHHHANAYLVLGLEGHIEVEAGNHRSRCGPGTVRLVYPGAAHRNRYVGPRVRNWLVQLDGIQFERMQPYLPAQAGMVLFGEEKAPVAVVCRMYREFCRQEPGWEFTIEALALEFAGLMARQRSIPSPPTPWLERARKLLLDQAGERIRISGVARQVGVHPVYLARRFREQYGMTPNAYLREVRLERARAALSGSRSGLSAIALRAGFSDQSQFTAHFRRRFGVTPARYRRLCRAQGSDCGEV